MPLKNFNFLFGLGFLSVSGFVSAKNNPAVNHSAASGHPGKK